MDLDINYENMDNLSKFVKDKSNEYLEQVTLFQEKIDELSNYWKGPDKEFFVKEVTSYYDKFLKLKDILDDYSVLISDISENNRNLENHIAEKTSDL